MLKRCAVLACLGLSVVALGGTGRSGDELDHRHQPGLRRRRQLGRDAPPDDFMELHNRGSAPSTSTAGRSSTRPPRERRGSDDADRDGPARPLLPHQASARRRRDGRHPERRRHWDDIHVGGCREGRARQEQHDDHVRDHLPDGPAVVDLVGYGAGTNCFEGAGPTGTLSNTTAALRNNQGCTETDQNGTDFTVGAPNPRNSTADAHLCDAETAPSVATSDAGRRRHRRRAHRERHGQLQRARQRERQLVHDLLRIERRLHGDRERRSDVLHPRPRFGLRFRRDLHGHGHGGPGLRPGRARPAGHHGGRPHVQLRHGSRAARDSRVQGSGHLSPYVGQSVTVDGVVMAERGSEVWLQDPAPDSNPATSEGILVFGSVVANAVVVGDLVRVRGTVTEFRPGCIPRARRRAAQFDNLTITEIAAPGHDGDETRHGVDFADRDRARRPGPAVRGDRGRLGTPETSRRATPSTRRRTASTSTSRSRACWCR